MTKNLETLKILTENLTSFKTITRAKGNGYLELDLINGTALGWNILYEKGLSVDKWFISKGSIFQEHSHKAKEIITVYQGTMILKIEDGREIELKLGDTYYIAPNIKHSSEYPEDCFFITITIPTEKGFPK